MTPGLALAIERVEAENPRPQTIQDDPQNMRVLGELLDQREQGETAKPAA